MQRKCFKYDCHVVLTFLYPEEIITFSSTSFWLLIMKTNDLNIIAATVLPRDTRSIELIGLQSYG